MTGFPVRIQRDGEYQSIDIDELTDAELERFAAEHPEKGWGWAKALARWIRDNVRVTDLAGRNGGVGE